MLVRRRLLVSKLRIFFMKLTENQIKVIQTCVQSIITALLLFVQSFCFSGCISNQDGQVTQNNNFVVPINVPVEDFPYPFNVEVPDEQ